MVNTEPLKVYIEGIEAYKSGDKTRALDLITKSIGQKKPTTFMEENLDKLAASNDAILRLVLHECGGT